MDDSSVLAEVLRRPIQWSMEKPLDHVEKPLYHARDQRAGEATPSLQGTSRR